MVVGQANETTRARRRLPIAQVALTLLAFGLLGWTIHRNREQLSGVWARRPDLRLLGLGLAVYVGALVVTFYRWFLLVRALGLPFRVRDAVRLGFIGNVFNLVIPGAVGGDVIKGAFLCREQERKTQAVASMVIDRVVGLLGLFVLAGAVGAFAWSDATGLARKIIVASWVLSASGLVGLAVLFTPGLYRPLLGLFAGGGRVGVMLRELVVMAGAYRERLGVIGVALALSTLSHALFVSVFFLACKALFHAGAPGLLAHFEVVPLTLLSTAIPLPQNALGVTENISGALFRDVLGFDGGAVAMLGYRSIMYAGALISVFVYLANLGQVRALRAGEVGP